MAKKYFTDESLATLVDEIKTGDAESLSSAKSYVDTEVAKLGITRLPTSYDTYSVEEVLELMYNDNLVSGLYTYYYDGYDGDSVLINYMPNAAICIMYDSVNSDTVNCIQYTNDNGNWTRTAELMSATDKIKLDGKADSDHTHDDRYHSKTEIDTEIADVNSTISTHTDDNAVHITSTERTNWNAAKTHADSAHAPSNAEKNQNAFSNVKVGSTTIAADATTDTLTFVGSNVTLTPDATNDKVTIGITQANVVSALGYTPQTSGSYASASHTHNDIYYTETEIDTKLNEIDTKLEGKVPTTRTVNEKALSTNITLSASDVGAMARTNPSGTGTLSLNREDRDTPGDYSVAVGYNTSASGKASHAEGYYTIASSNYSHAEGQGATASGDGSHAEGFYTVAFGDFSHAEGEETGASGYGSHAEGCGTEASGTNSHAEGFGTVASGSYSHAGGYYTVANTYQYVVGKYNTNTTAPTSLTDTTSSAGLFIVGIGTSDLARKNGFRVNPAGKIYGIGTFGTSGADYAEYFEWFDGNPNNEDRRGHFVTLEGNKIRYATSNDDYILGVVSANPSVAGDICSEDWHNTYLKDVFGSKIVDVVEVEETTNKNGEIIPAHTERRWVLNPNYNPDLKYTSREERPEWAAIGLVGKLVVVDDGTCQVNSYCQPNVDGIATASQKKTNYRVMERLDDTHIKIFIR